MIKGSDATARQAMRYGSVCSGIEAASAAWHPLGWEPQWFSEIGAFPCAVLRKRWPMAPNLGDMTQIHEQSEFKRRPIDLLVGGTPCQSFSAAGLRKGLADPRGNLALVFLSILGRKRPRWVVWENVPGVLSSWSDEAGSFKDESFGRHRGWQSNDFDIFTGALQELGYGLAWRVLDAQFFGVPQRRRRVFVVGHLGDWRLAAAVLFERHGLSGHPPPSRQTGKGIAPTLAGRPTGGGGLGTDFDLDGGWVTKALIGKDHATHDPTIAPCVVGAFKPNQGAASRSLGYEVDKSPTLEAAGGGNNKPAVHIGMAVRRLTPRECERLQGFPDDYTLIPFGTNRAKDIAEWTSYLRRRYPDLSGDEARRLAADCPRYKAIGNSMAVNVMRWIGIRIAWVDRLVRSR
jgi:DNA (cytosine-5)-methyltransferase 1